MPIVAASAACGVLVGFESVDFVGEETSFDGAVDGADASIDGAPSEGASDAAAKHVCSDAEDFCDDFERTAPLQGAWTTAGARQSATMFLEAGTFVVAMTTQDASSPMTPSAGLTLDAPWVKGNLGGRRRTGVRFRALVEECPAAGEVNVFAISLGETELALTLASESSQCVLGLLEITFPGGPTYRRSSPVIAPRGVWEEYGVELVETAPDAGGQALLHVGGNTRSFALTSTPPPARYAILFGLACPTLIGADARVRFEDFRAEYLR
jgi:hypothetical protein